MKNTKVKGNEMGRLETGIQVLKIIFGIYFAVILTLIYLD